MEAHRIGAKLLDRGHWVFGHKYRIAGVEIRSHELLARGFDYLARLPRLQILVILDADLETRVHDLAAYVTQDLDYCFNVRLYGAIVRHAVAVARNQDSDNWRSHRGRALDVIAQRGHHMWIMIGRLRQDGAAAGFDMQPAFLRPGPHVGPVLGIHDASIERVLQKNRVQLLCGAVVDQLAVIPALKAKAVSSRITEFSRYSLRDCARALITFATRSLIPLVN